jgi:hypothetical protein
MKPHFLAGIVVIALSAGCSDAPSKKYKTMSLPHCESLDDSKPEELLAKVVGDRGSHVDLAISNFGLSESEWEHAYTAFEGFYEARAKEISAILGDPAWEGSWTSDEYPDWALGENITIWDHPGGKIYLRIYQEDREIPIIIALGTSDSTNGFNAEGESPYKATREYLKSQGKL